MTRLTPTALCYCAIVKRSLSGKTISITRNDSIPKTDSLIIEELKDNVTR